LRVQQVRQDRLGVDQGCDLLTDRLARHARSGLLVHDADEFALGLDQRCQCLLNLRSGRTGLTLSEVDQFALGGNEAAEGILERLRYGPRRDGAVLEPFQGRDDPEYRRANGRVRSAAPAATEHSADEQ